MSEPVIVYRDVPGSPGYRVGDDGSVWSCRRTDGRLSPIWHKLNPILANTNRYVVTLRNKPPHRPQPVHRLILEVFFGPCPEGMECCHNDGNPHNNKLDNLRWDTRKSNVQDKFKHGKHPIGTNHYKAKLTEDQVRTIRKEYASLTTSREKLAKKYGVSSGAIQCIVDGRTWKHVV